MKTSEVIVELSKDDNESIFINEMGQRVRSLACQIVWCEHGRKPVELTKLFLSHKWKLDHKSRKQVDFVTAANSGKRISPVDEPLFRNIEVWSWGGLTLERINGKWFIED